jgi:hypothetical protein
MKFLVNIQEYIPALGTKLQSTHVVEAGDKVEAKHNLRMRLFPNEEIRDISIIKEKKKK